MKRIIAALIPLVPLGLALAINASENDMNTEKTKPISIIRSAPETTQQGAAEYFTGSVRIEAPFGPDEPSRIFGASVFFEPGARSAWHTHPLGQLLVVTAGSGLVQRWGDEAQPIRQGDIVWIPAHTKHWHGAAPDTAMTHVAIVEQEGGSGATWMELVDDDQYGNPPADK